ncbi:MAG: MBL fold metallo-hydrolase [SAR86 cluster bacterium]|uniref:MBL fold metallo-hydrolase n=1 Tax=SAR86 cluster bacterium TaxID=2030880 RepID=A0A2A5CFL5_9GAMM|nr:MBL fold metallo-hydrolase [Gammaproteobacteria bacterium AH-315-E17]PCJ42667.1 MAG: MBL fold metallo-hydrolase [SAR86 cluster bacterium]
MKSILNININQSIKPEVEAFYDDDTGTFSYVVKDPSSKSCAIIDSVMDFDYASGAISYTGANRIIDYVKSHDLSVEWLIETHIHADHLSAAYYLRGKLGGKLGIGSNITFVQNLFSKIFNVESEFKRDGSQFDRLFEDGDSYKIGKMTAYAIHTPGHTPACMTHVIGDAAFVGDTIFMPDGGTARADFPGGDAGELYISIEKVLSLPSQTRLFMCHDYPENREVACQTTVAREKAENIHVHDGLSKKQFEAIREARDAKLAMPRLILPSLQVNMRAGQLPPAENNNMIYLKVPINAFIKANT